MGFSALVFMITVWGIIIGATLYTLAQVMKHSRK